MPHETGVEWNGDSIKPNILNIGEIFREAGYNTVWGGKWHLPESFPQRAKARNKSIRGFDLLPFRDPDIENWMLGSETDPPLTKAVVDFLTNHDKARPFFLTVSYHNPHDICFYARKDGWETEADSLLEIRHYGFEYKLPDVVGQHPSKFDPLPDLPKNHDMDVDEPAFITEKRLYHNEYGLETHLAYEEFGELEWKGYLNAYYRLTELVDVEIGKVLDALEVNKLDENTIIIFTSDHGDGAASHKWSAKLSLYKESAMVPMLVSYPGVIGKDVTNDRHLVSQIDIVPTICDYAGVESPVPFTGHSLRAIIEDSNAPWRDFLVMELADYSPDRTRKARMLCTKDFKYNIYSSGARNEQLFDTRNDPGEQDNLINDPRYISTLSEHKDMLTQWMIETEDTFLK